MSGGAGEPGSPGWRGTGRDAGLQLPFEAHAQAVRRYQAAEKHRERIDSSVSAATEGLARRHGGTQAGADSSLKSWESYRRKVADRVRQGRPPEEAIQQNDLHRYTCTFPPETYVDGVRDCCEQLAGAGLTPESGKNYWDSDHYKGINTVWTHNGTGQRVEFQFHTPRSYEIKQETHPYYEVERSTHLADGSTEVSPEVVQACRSRMAEAYRSTEPGRECRVPPGNETLWPDRQIRTRTDRPSEQALATADREAAAARAAALPPPSAEGAGWHGELGSAPPRLPESMRGEFTHVTDRSGQRGPPGLGNRDPRRPDRELE